MATRNPPLPAGIVTNVADALSLVAGSTYAVQNAGDTNIIFGEYPAASVPDPFNGHPLAPGADFELTANAAEPLYAMAVSGDGELAVTGAG